MLRGLEPSNPHYNAAHKVMAELYLTYRNDQRMYAQVMMPPPSAHGQSPTTWLHTHKHRSTRTAWFAPLSPRR